MGNVWKWLLRNDEVVVRAGEFLIAVGKAARDSIRPAKPKEKD